MDTVCVKPAEILRLPKKRSRLIVVLPGNEMFYSAVLML